jgi:hypothetical protein
MRISLAIFLLFVVRLASGQEIELEGWELKQFNFLQQEIKIAKRSLQIEDLKISDDVKRLIKEVAESERQEMLDTHLFCVPKSIRTGLWNDLRKTTAPEKQDQLEAYINTAEKFVERSSRDAVTCIVVFLDNHLFLTKEQFSEIEETVWETWPQHENFPAFLLTFRSLRTKRLLEALDHDAINIMLTEPQRELFAEMETLAFDPHTLFGGANGSVEVDSDTAQKCFQLGMTSLTNELSHYHEITDKDRSLLRVAGNGASKSIRKVWSNAGSLDGDENEVLYTTPIVTQLARQAIVLKVIKQILGEELESYEAERLRRQKVRTRCLVNYLLFFYFNNSSKIRVDDTSRDAISNAICEKLNAMDYVDFQTVSRVLLKESKDIFEANLNEFQYDKLKGYLN